MILPTPGAPLSVEEYLRLEALSPVRHEYVAGERFAMAGGTLRHNTISLNVATRLRALVRQGACSVYANVVKVRAAPDVFFYPDVVVQCEAADDTDTWLREPCLVIEVVSPGTSRTDRGEKLLAYRAMPSVQLYLIVQQRSRSVDVHRRVGATGEWAHDRVVGEGRISLPCPGGTISLDEVYAGVTLPALGEPEAWPYAVREEAEEDEPRDW